MVIGNVAMVLFVSYICHKDTDKAIQAMSSVYAILLTMNLITMYLYPHGMYNMDQWEIYHRSYWLFGHQNTTVTYALPALCLALLKMYDGDKKRKHDLPSYYLIIVSIISIIISRSITSIIGLVVFLFILWMMHRNLWEKVLNAKWAIIGGSILCVLIVFFQVQFYFSSAIENLLQRSATFTSRTLIWDRTLAAIYENWMWGIGYKVNTVLQQTIHGSSAHNEYLYSVLQGGVVLLALFLGTFYCAARALDKIRDSSSSKMFIALIFSLFVQFLAETHMHRIAPIIALIGCASCFVNKPAHGKERISA